MKLMSIGAAIVSLILAPGVLTPEQASAQEAGTDIRTDIQELRKGQEEIRKELAEIRKLLTPRPAATVEKLERTVTLGSIPSRGDRDAPVTIIEFSDYQCPYCRRHTEQTLPGLIKEYVETGKVRYAFRDLPLAQLHPLAPKAAEAARCAGDQGKYWEMHDRLFANQKELQVEKLPAHAQSIGLDEGTFRECLESSRHAGAVQEDLEAGSQLGFRGTPTIVVGLSAGGGVDQAVVIHGAQPLTTFRTEIDKLLAASAPAK